MKSAGTSVFVSVARRAALSIAAAMLVVQFTHASEPPEPLTAIWRVQELKLVHRDAQTLHTCQELLTRVVAILGALGMHPARAADSRCRTVDYTQSLTLTLLRPVEATPENVREATAFNGTQRLLAHLRNEPLPASADLQRFPAVWRTVSLDQLRSPRLSRTDCSLLLTLKQQVFPRLSVRMVEKNSSCRTGATHIRPKVIAEALVPLPG